ncbi:MAG: hypothetical protein ABF991_00745 [Liquorilactobacillus hordei]|uniref:hypothetical protein n=1 Tax=Liquorilactobacillus hordei TaxID=468911 RepID=UPI0039E7B5CB
MDINYTSLLLKGIIPFNDKVKIYSPTIDEITTLGEEKFSQYVKPFSITIRELYSGMAEIVDQVEEAFPTLWDMSFDKEGNKEIGNMISQSDRTLHQLFAKGFAYWTRLNEEDFQFLSNKKAICKKLNWVIDKEEYLNFSECIRAVTLSKPNEDLIAPKNMSKAQLRIWKNVYKGRVRKLSKEQKVELGDKILILQGSSASYISFKEIGEMNYYQFNNLLKVFMEKEYYEQTLQIYTAYKFDTSDMELKNWREKISLQKNI